MLALALLPLLAAAPEPRLGAYGHLITHPGFTASLAWPLAARAGWSAWAGPALGAYWHPRYQVATWVGGELTARHQGDKAGQQELFLSTGPLRATWAAPTYDAAGARERLAGDAFWSATAGLGFGRTTDLGPLSAWSLRPQLSVRFPHARGVGLDAALELSLRFGGAS